jgi:hypothetical protein
MEALLNPPLSKAAPGDITAPQYDEKSVHFAHVYIAPYVLNRCDVMQLYHTPPGRKTYRNIRRKNPTKHDENGDAP